MDAQNMIPDENGKYNWGIANGSKLLFRSTEFDSNGEEKQLSETDFISGNKFSFNGTNYINIYKENNGFDFQQGITVECYGNLQIISANPFASLLANFTENCDVSRLNNARFLLWNNGKALYYNLAGWKKVNNEVVVWDNGYTHGSETWNLEIPLSETTVAGRDVYISIVVNPQNYVDENNIEYENKICQKIYVDGIEIVSSYLDREYWKNFLTYNWNGIDIGSIYFGGTTTTKLHTNGDIYSFRFYNRALNSEEIETNYSKTLMYRSMFN